MTEQTTGLSDEHRQRVRDRGFSDRQIDWMIENKILRTLTWEEVKADWLEMFPAAKRTNTGGLLLCFNPMDEKPSFSLRCDNPPIERKVTGDRPSKYLYPKNAPTDEGEINHVPKGERIGALQPFNPRRFVGPAGGRFPEPQFATEGLFDALACTLLIGIPCIGLTAPSHMKGSVLPDSCKVYIGDCDQWLAPNLLGTVVGQCRSKQLRISRLPLRAGREKEYLVENHRDLPSELKGGFEELYADHGRDKCQKLIKDLLTTSREWGDYVKHELSFITELGAKWPKHQVIISNFFGGIAQAYPSTHKDSLHAVKRDALIQQMHDETGMGLRVAQKGVQAKLAAIAQRKKEEKVANRAADEAEALSRGEVLEPEIERENPSNLELQNFLQYKHTIEFDELKRRPLLDGNTINPLPLFYQLLAQQHQIQCQKAQASDVLMYCAMSNPFNPVERYLEGVRDNAEIQPANIADIVWAFGLDPEDRLSAELLCRSLGGTAVRGLEPGAKFDQMPVLQGPQGFYKSEVLKALATPEWFGELGEVSSFTELSSWKVTEKITSCWIVECGECDRLMNGKTASDLKNWLSTTDDIFAEKGQPLAESHPRRMVPWGTTNQDELLNDPTGNRRYWVMHVVQQCQLKWVAEHRDEIWKAVLGWLDAGMKTWVATKSEAAQRIAERGMEATVQDDWVDSVLGFLEGRNDGFGMYRTAWDTKKPLTRPILLEQALGMKPKDMTRAHSFRIGRVMKDPRITEKGWEAKKTKSFRGWVWNPPASEAGDKAGAPQEEVVTELSPELSPQTPWNDCLYREGDKGDNKKEVEIGDEIKKDPKGNGNIYDLEISEKGKGCHLVTPKGDDRPDPLQQNGCRCGDEVTTIAPQKLSSPENGAEHPPQPPQPIPPPAPEVA